MESDLAKGRKDIANFTPTSVNSTGTRIVLIGTFEKEEGVGIVILERDAWKAENIKIKEMQINLDFVNNQYSQYKSEIKSSVVVQVIFPASERDLKKYASFEYVAVTETAELFRNVTKPYIEGLDKAGEKWIIDILEGRAEQERTLLLDKDLETGFLLSSSWGSGEALKDIHLLAMVNRRDLRCLRDLNRSHLPLLKNVRIQMLEYVKTKYNCEADKFLLFLHYQPSYYHVHIHGVYYEATEVGVQMYKGRSLNEIIDNIEVFDNYYEKATLQYLLSQVFSVTKTFT